jgi:carbonic anhydrase
VVLTGLDRSTTYYYEVESTDAYTNMTTDDNGGLYYSFTTSDTTPPVITNVQVVSVGDTTATIEWTTDEAANSVVNYGNTTTLGSSEVDVSLVTSHSVVLTGLVRSTTYYYEVRSTDAYTNTATDDNTGAYYTFTTSDTTPPVITNVQAMSVADTTATIEWDTDEPADSVVRYGNTTALGQTEYYAALVTGRSVLLSGLERGTTYYYEVQSTDAYTNTTMDDNSGAYYTFTTTDNVPPVISAVQTVSITDTTATIEWTTDELADSVVRYGETTAVVLTESDASLVFSHSVVLSGLIPGTLYYYEVESSDVHTNTATDDNGGVYFTFTTPDTTPPVISGVTTSSITDTSALVSWDTDEPADSRVNYGNTTALGQTEYYDVLGTGRTILLSGLTPDTTYYYEVQSKDEDANTATDNNGGAYYSFTTSDATPPVITGVRAIAIGDHTATVEWITDELADSVVRYGNTTALGLTASDASLLNGHSLVLSGLHEGTTYYYEVESTDGNGNTATDDNGGLYYTFITTDNIPPVISGVWAASVTDTTATIQWTTDEPADSVVNYGNTTALGSTESYAVLVTGRSVLLSGLEPGMTYYYEGQSTEVWANTATDDNGGLYYSFTTSDTTPPVISNVRELAITDNFATIIWDTDELSDSVVRYGNTTALGLTASDASLVFGHSVQLSGLAPGMTYYYEVESTDIYTNTATDDNGGLYYSFATSDTTPPVISGVRAESVTDNFATITWGTDEPSDSVVRYGNTTALGFTVSDASLAYAHYVVLSGLEPGMTYYYEVESTDAYTNTVTDDNSGAYYSFATSDTTPPVISNVRVLSVADNFATIIWDTDELSDSVVRYGNTTALGLTASDASMVFGHSVQLSGLAPGMTYYYEVESTDAYANTAVDDNGGVYYGFSTSDTTPPVISDVRAESVADNSATITWATDEPAGSVVRYGNTTALGGNATDASLVYAHYVVISGLEPGMTYYYEVESTDADANTAVDDNGGVYYSFTTTDTTPPVISNVRVLSVTDNFATIIWDTDEYSGSVVNYGNTTSLGLTASDASLVLGHSVQLSGLAPGMTYYYEVQSTDAYTNTATDDNGGLYYGFTTSDTTPPVISGVRAESITDNFATITWGTDEPSDSVVRYGQTTALGGNMSAAGLTYAHYVAIGGLEEGTTYYYEVESTDENGNTAVDDNGGLYYSFTTPDTTPPVISGVQAIDITTTTVTITWTTDEPADSVVNYGGTPALGLSRSYVVLVTGRSVLLSGLDIGTTYYYEVRSTDMYSNTAVDDNGGAYYTFSTLVPDFDPPVITDVRVEAITDDSATITWTTDEPANSVVRYGGNISALDSTETDASLVIDHSVQLSGINPETTYFFEIESTDGSANTATDDNGGLFYSFTTLEADVTPPAMSGIQAVNIRATSATIVWTTDEPSDSVVRYGNTTALGYTESYALFVTDHSVELTGLVQGATYYYEVESTDDSGNTGIDDNGGLYHSFATLTPETDPPVISGIQVIDIRTTSVRVTWTTDEPADSVVHYGNTTALGATTSDASLVTSHSVLLNDLDPSMTYLYDVWSTDGVGNTAIDDNGGLYHAFTTLTPETIPPVISAVQSAVTSDNTATVTWTTDEPADSVVNYGQTPALGLTASIPSLVIDHSVPLSGLDPGTGYYYEVQSTDGADNTATDNNGGLHYTFMTTESVPPVISDVQVVDIRTNSVRITWTTDEPTDSVVNYGNSTLLGLTTSDAALVISHSVVLSGLDPAETYFFEVQSSDWSLNTTTDDNGGLYYSFTTLVPESTPPVISGVQDVNIRTTSFTVVWSTDEPADSVVNYGNTTALGLTESDTSLRTSHSVVLTGLDTGTTHYFEVRSMDGSYNVAIDDNSGLYFQSTTLVPEFTPPVISGVRAINLTMTTARIVWTTDEPADSVVNYGSSTALGLTRSDGDLVISHSVLLTGLTPGTMYYFEVQSTDGSDNTAIDNNNDFYYGFKTLVPETAPPVITELQAVAVLHDSAIIVWTTDEPANSVVNYGDTPALGLSVTDNRLLLSHSMRLTSLSPLTTYYYEVRSTDGNGNTGIDDNGGLYFTFTTLEIPDTTPPVISNVGAGNITMTTAVITWTTDEPADSAVRYGTDTGLGLSASAAHLVTDHRVSLGGLIPGNTTYYYEVESVDAAGNPTIDDNGGIYYTFTTSEIPAPIITDVVATAITATSAVVTWTTDMPATSVVLYGPSIPPTNRLEDLTRVTEHAVPVTGLETTTTYYFEVQSTGETGATSIDNNGGAYYTLTIFRLTGWGWCTDYEEIANVEFVANGTLEPVSGAQGSSHAMFAGNVTLSMSDSTESIGLEMYGTKVRSFFSMGQDAERKSAGMSGVWMIGEDGQYLSTWGRITLPEGRIFKTAKVYVLHLRTADVEIPEREPGGFVDDLEYILMVIIRFIDGLIDKLMLSDFAEILGKVLAKLMILLAAVRNMGIPYIP